MNDFIKLVDYGQENGIHYRAYIIGGTDAYFECARPYHDKTKPYIIYAYPDDHRYRFSNAILRGDETTVEACVDPDLLTVDKTSLFYLLGKELDPECTHEHKKRLPRELWWQIDALTRDLQTWVDELNTPADPTI